MDDSTKAYIAGFLDGDGSIMLPIKPRRGVRYGYRIYATLCLYQDASHEKELLAIRDQLQVGYVSRRKDGIAELRIDGYERVEQVLRQMGGYVRFKSHQVKLMLDALTLLKGNLTAEQFLQVCRLADEIAHANYTVRRKYSAATVEAYLRRKGLLSP